MNQITSRKGIDWSLVILFNFMWATQVPVIRLIGDRMGPITVAFIPLILSTFLFLPLLWLENRRRKVQFRWRWKDIRHFILPAFIGIFLMQYLYTLGSQKTLAANAGIITLTIPVLVAVFASVMLKERLNPVRIFSFFLAIVGVLITSVSDLAGADFTHGRFLLGNLIFLVACCCCAFYNTYCKVLVDKQYTELEILVYSSIIASLLSIPMLIWVEPFHLSAFLRTGSIALAGVLELGVVVYGVSMILFFSVLKRMDVTQAILGCYLLPFFISILGVLLLHERITWLMALGGGVILLSTLMVTIYEERLLGFFRSGLQKYPAPDPPVNTINKL
ncbi:MAG: DMT family transporter [Chitinophagaceae bacterium]|nr:DMT family transporter [Chitinophagaceae bacterium]